MPRLAEGSPFPTGKILCLLAAYFLAHIMVRVTVSDSLELDEAEQLVLGQALSWGYGTKPPLYSWLQIGFFRVFGESVLALSLLKNLLLFATYFCTFLAARKVTERAETALIAALTLMMIPQIVWESQRDLTHSVLATAVAALTLYLFLRLCEERRTALYLAFGAVVGLGFLAKFNVVILPVALIVAALSLPGLRPVILERRGFLSLAALLAVTGGYLVWFANNSDAVLAQAGTFHIKKSRPYWQALIMGNASLVKAVVTFGGVAFALLLAIFWRPETTCSAGEAHHRQYRQLLGRALLVTLLMLELMVIFFQVTYFKDRWLLPVLFYAPAWLVFLLAGRPAKAAVRSFLAVCLAISLTVLLLLPARTLLAAQRNTFTEHNVPYNRFAEQLRQRGFEQGVIVTENGLVAGNLRLHLPNSSVVAAGLPQPRLAPFENCLIVWDATEDPNPPSALLKLTGSLQIPVDRKQAEILEAPFHYGGDSPRMARLGILRCRPEPVKQADEVSPASR
jgi:4-amino-4-deoxy-L-arabinose transferase-like glycosyltransferase